MHKVQILTGDPVHKHPPQYIHEKDLSFGHRARCIEECGVYILHYTVWSVESAVYIVEFGVWSVDLERGVCTAHHWAVQFMSVLQPLRYMCCTEVLLYPTHICLSPSLDTAWTLDSQKIATEQHCTALQWIQIKKKNILYINGLKRICNLTMMTLWIQPCY